jgi:lysine-specific demethylase 3
MNALQDPAKKLSINSLLNPQESLAHPVGAHHGQNQSNQQSSMFRLRAASWDPDDDPYKLGPLNGAHDVDRQYQQHPTLYYPLAAPSPGDAHSSRRMMGPSIDESAMYPGEGQVWDPKHPQQQQHHHQHAVSGMWVLYSEERTGIFIS